MAGSFDLADSFDFEALMSKVGALEQSVLSRDNLHSPERRAAGGTPKSRADAAVERLEASLAKYSGGKVKATPTLAGDHHDWETLQSPSSDPGPKKRAQKTTKKVKKVKRKKRTATGPAAAKWAVTCAVICKRSSLITSCVNGDIDFLNTF